MSWSSAFETVSCAADLCRRCGACAPRCEVLQPAGEALTVGGLAAAFAEAGNAEGVSGLAHARPDLVFAVRRCCMDGFCTLICPDGIEARPVFAALRELLALAGVTGTDGFTMTQVDREWHIFSAYRAVQKGPFRRVSSGWCSSAPAAATNGRRPRAPRVLSSSRCRSFWRRQERSRCPRS